MSTTSFLYLHKPCDPLDFLSFSPCSYLPLYFLPLFPSLNLNSSSHSLPIYFIPFSLPLYLFLSLYPPIFLSFIPLFLSFYFFLFFHAFFLYFFNSSLSIFFPFTFTFFPFSLLLLFFIFSVPLYLPPLISTCRKIEFN